MKAILHLAAFALLVFGFEPAAKWALGESFAAFVGLLMFYLIAAAYFGAVIWTWRERRRVPLFLTSETPTPWCQRCHNQRATGVRWGIPLCDRCTKETFPR